MRIFTVLFLGAVLGLALLLVNAIENRPDLNFSILFGGMGEDSGRDIAIDNQENIFIFGSTTSSDLQVTDDST